MKITPRSVALLAVAFGTELLADSAVNSFASATGPGIMTAGDSGFVTVNAQGPVPLALVARPGWQFLEGKRKEVTFYPSQTLRIPIFGLDGEERANLTVSNELRHVHLATNYQEHVSCGMFDVSVDSHSLKLYAPPEKGAKLFASGKYEVVSNCVHEAVVDRVPCPIPACAWGRDEGRTTRTEISFEPLPAEVIWSFGEEMEFYPQGRYQFTYGVRYTNACKRCCFGASDSGEIEVFQAKMNTQPWIGLDRTDAGRKVNPVKIATATVCDLGEAVEYAWTPSEHCEAVAGGDTAVFSYQPQDHDTPSETYLGEEHSCAIAISDAHGCSDSVQVTNRFTIVKLDVQLGEDDNEATEETAGYNLYEVPDRDGAWTEEATNALVQVKITCEPHDAKMLTETVTVEVRDELLYECREVNGRREYVPARASYSVRELLEKKFVLHGHTRSREYLGEAIKVTHPTSGAVDLAKFTIFGRPWLVPDYDRLNGIDDAELAMAKDGKLFRFWINDDDDWGDTCLAEEYTEDMTGAGNDCEESRVSGRRDLIDYAPVMIDVSEVFPAGTPEELRKPVWLLKSSCLNVVWSSVTGGQCRRFQTEDLMNCGPEFNSVAYKAPVAMLSRQQELPLPSRTARQLDAVQRPVFFVEGSNTGAGLSILGRTRDGSLLTMGYLDIRIDSVRNMYHWASIRADDETSPAEAKRSPKHWPDEDTDQCNYVFVHGFNVNPQEARASGEELFKRLWQSGLKSMVSVINWDGDYGQFDPVGDWHGSLCVQYYESVRRAFLRARKLDDICASALPGSKIMLAHSLGNVLTSAAIVDHGLAYRRYWMIDAAVAIEAYSAAGCDREEMVGSGWGKAPKEYWASRWWKLHPQDDFRHLLAWDDRFKNISNAINCYSETEDVVGNYNPKKLELNQSAWYLQEINKGLAWHHITDIAFKGRIRTQGGWGVNNYYLWNPLYCLGGVFLDRIKRIPVSQAIEHPLFTTFCLEGEDARKMYSTELYTIESAEKRDELRAFLLGGAIPAESYAAGANAMKISGIEDLDMMTKASNTEVWPQLRRAAKVVGHRENGRTGKMEPIYKGYDLFWYHSDFKQVAYFFNYQLFDEFIRRR